MFYNYYPRKHIYWICTLYAKNLIGDIECADDCEIQLNGLEERSHFIPARNRESVWRVSIFAKFYAKLNKKTELHNS